jgi:CheY-like chemotaxis protein
MHNPSVLVVDDCEIERHILSHQLKKIGVSKLIEKSDGTTGLAFLSDYQKNQQIFGTDFPPTLIILDVNMPLVGGFEFLRQFTELSGQHDLSRCHIIMYSGANDPDEKKQAMQYECVKAYLVKGESSIDELKSTIEAI